MDKIFKILVAAIILLLLSGCEYPTMPLDENGNGEIEMFGVYMRFEVCGQRIKIRNTNWNSASVKIELKDTADWNTTIWRTIYNDRVSGNSGWRTYDCVSSAGFQPGDTIQVKVSIPEGSDTNYFIIGEVAGSPGFIFKPV